MTKQLLVFLCELAIAAEHKPQGVYFRDVARRIGIEYGKEGGFVQDLKARGFVENVTTGGLVMTPEGIQEARERFDAGDVTVEDLDAVESE